MSSFLATCPKCGSMFAKGSICPECRFSENAPTGRQQQSFIQEYQSRKDRHTRNYTIFMVLMFGTGVVGLLIAWMWLRIIYTGDIIALILLIPLHLLLFGLGFMLKVSKKWFPTDVHCPGCDLRVDELGLDDNCCPGCKAQLQ